jgi:hypothetical protein
MKIEMEVPEYLPNRGFEFKWEGDFKIETKFEENILKVVANKDGLLSLANHFLNLAQDKVPSGYHIHLDENNSLENNSLELIIEKK